MSNTELEIRQMTFEDAWQTFKTEIETNTQEYQQTRFGINIKFDINDYLKDRITIKPKIGKAYIKGTSYELEQLETELEQRERIIKKWLIKTFKDEDIATPRGI